MTRARREQISLAETPYYHCISRCVRRAFLCGYDRYADRDYEHRRGWIRAKMGELVEIFALDLYAYAIMSNHYHVVLRVDEDTAAEWTDDEVLRRWTRLFKGPELVRMHLAGDVLSEAESDEVARVAALWRERLMDISWFMRYLNEAIATEANREDGCKGRFFEGRFKSQALLDERAVLACMAYVDLNPVRAGIAETPEDSDYTSVQQRSRPLAEPSEPADETQADDAPTLAPLVTAESADDAEPDGIGAVRLMDYLELVDHTGRALREDKRGAIPSNALPVFQRLGIEPETWMRHMRPRRNHQLQALGAEPAMRRFAETLGRQWLWGMRSSAGLFVGCTGASHAAT